MFEVEVGLELAEVGQSFAAGGLSQTAAAADLLGTAVLGRTAAVAVLLFAGSQKFAQRRTETVAADQIVAVAAGQTVSFGIEEGSAVAVAVVWAAATGFAELEAAAKGSAEAVAKGSASVEKGSS